MKQFYKKTSIAFVCLLSSSISAHSQMQSVPDDDILNYSYKVQAGNFSKNVYYATGTGFICKFRDEFFLVTNYHVLTGLNPKTNLPLYGTEIATHSMIYFRSSVSSSFKKLVFPIYDSTKNRLFSIYRDHNNELLDIAVVHLDKTDFPPKSRLYFFTDSSIDNRVNLRNRYNIVVAGFLDGQMLNDWQPTIKTAKSFFRSDSMALMPSFLFFNNPTGKGMSGSPVYIEDSLNKKLKLVAINTMQFPANKSTKPVIGAAVYFKYAHDLISEMIRRKAINVELKR